MSSSCWTCGRAKKASRFGSITTTEAGDVYVGDPFRVQQILNNLIGNAVKFTDRGGVTVTVRPGDNRIWQGVIIEIADTGIGIAPEKLDLIFEKVHPGRQLDDAQVRRLGAGLSIGKALAERMDGR